MSKTQHRLINTRAGSATSAKQQIPYVRIGRLIICFGLFLLIVQAPLVGAEAGMDPAKLKRIPVELRSFVENDSIAGAVALVARHGQIASLEAVGYSDIANHKPMQADNLFWIASMTKPLTAAAVQMLQDEGKLSVEDPVERYLPEFTNLWMIQEKVADRLVLVKAPRPITLRDLLTHTSGLGDVSSPRPDVSLAELVMAYSQQPLHFAPGSRWEYSSSGINTLGRIVEVVSGQRFQDFLQARLFKPLRMKNTTLYPTRNQLQRLAKSYQPPDNGRGLEEVSIFLIKGGLASRARTAMPAWGLFSTASDMSLFYQMMLDGGVFEGRRLLSAAAVEMMTRTQTGTLETGWVEGMSFGLGFAVVKRPVGVTGMYSVGTFGHGGAYGTQSWADPKKDLILILMIQRAKMPNADNTGMRRAFQEAAVAAMVD